MHSKQFLPLNEQQKFHHQNHLVQETISSRYLVNKFGLQNFALKLILEQNSNLKLIA